jgi:hypothetical protein
MFHVEHSDGARWLDVPRETSREDLDKDDVPRETLRDESEVGEGCSTWNILHDSRGQKP